MAADELRGRVDDHVGAVLYRADEERRAEGVVHDDDNPVAVGYLRDAVDVCDAGVGVAERLYDDCFCVGSEGCFHGGEVGRVYYRVAHALR